MLKCLCALTFAMSMTSALALEATPVTVTPILRTTDTMTGQQIVLPQTNAEVIASMYSIAPGAELPVHEHKCQRYGYLLSGTLTVTNLDTGKVSVFHPGDFIVESLSQWHKGANTGADP